VFNPDRIVAATARLDPESRALVELSARRGMSDEEIAGVLDVEPAEVTRRHDEALAQLAAELGEPRVRRYELRDRLLRVDETTWRGEAEPATVELGAVEGGAAAEDRGTAGAPRGREAGPRGKAGPRSKAGSSGEGGPRRGAGAADAASPRGAGAGAAPSRRDVPPRVLTPAAPGRRPLLPIAVGLIAAVVAVVFIVVLVRSGNDEGGSSKQSSDGGKTQQTDTSNPGASAPASAPARTMQRLNGTYGHGTAQLIPRGDTSVLRVRASGFLRPQGGGYAVWLVKATDDARRVYATADTTISASFAVPADFKRYKYVEVARAIPNLDSDYSGLVLLRVPVPDLEGQ
jgi:hypothetical protein